MALNPSSLPQSSRLELLLQLSFPSSCPPTPGRVPSSLQPFLSSLVEVGRRRSRLAGLNERVRGACLASPGIALIFNLNSQQGKGYGNYFLLIFLSELLKK